MAEEQRKAGDMKRCPCCGFEPTPSNRQLLSQYRKAFDDLPVMAMVERGWLGDVDRFDITAVKAAVLKFFGAANEAELEQILSASTL